MNIASLCVLIIYDLYISLIVLYVRHYYYIDALLHATEEDRTVTDSSSINKYFTSCVIPMYRGTYFGYLGIVVPHNGVATPLYVADKLKVYGYIRHQSLCSIKYIKNYAKVIVVLDSTDYGDFVMEDLRVIYRNVILISIGGLILWKVSLLFMTF